MISKVAKIKDNVLTVSMVRPVLFAGVYLSLSDKLAKGT